MGRGQSCGGTVGIEGGVNVVSEAVKINWSSKRRKAVHVNRLCIPSPSSTRVCGISNTSVVEAVIVWCVSLRMRRRFVFVGR